MEMTPKERKVRAAAIELMCAEARDLKKSLVFSAIDLLDRCFLKNRALFMDKSESTIASVKALALVIEKDSEISQAIAK